MSDYLWDRSGEPDPEIRHLEDVLGTLRSKRPSQKWPAESNLRAMPGRARWVEAAFAAGLVVLMLGASWLVTRPVRTGWIVARVDGTPVLGSRPVHTTGELAIGDWLVTDNRSRARMAVSNIGEVDVEPNSRVRLLRAHGEHHRLALDLGAMHAFIWAPPRMFTVETPAAVAVDLGCEYTLNVDAAGVTTLHVITGWVSFEQGGHESFVPAGAASVTRPGGEPGTPYFLDSSDQFRASLEKFDFEHDARWLDGVLRESRKRDAVTLWHLLPKTRGAERLRVYERMSELVPPPAGVSREGILAADRRMLDRWWEALGYNEASWWRMWKGPSPFETRK
jgi:FecR protein